MAESFEGPGRIDTFPRRTGPGLARGTIRDSTEAKVQYARRKASRSAARSTRQRSAWAQAAGHRPPAPRRGLRDVVVAFMTASFRDVVFAGPGTTRLVPRGSPYPFRRRWRADGARRERNRSSQTQLLGCWRNRAQRAPGSRPVKRRAARESRTTDVETNLIDAGAKFRRTWPI